MPFCKYCGSELDADAVFCTECGTPIVKKAVVAEKTVQEVPVAAKTRKSFASRMVSDPIFPVIPSRRKWKKKCKPIGPGWRNTPYRCRFSSSCSGITQLYLVKRSGGLPKGRWRKNTAFQILASSARKNCPTSRQNKTHQTPPTAVTQPTPSAIANIGHSLIRMGTS